MRTWGIGRNRYRCELIALGPFPWSGGVDWSAIMPEPNVPALVRPQPELREAVLCEDFPELTPLVTPVMLKRERRTFVITVSTVD